VIGFVIFGSMIVIVLEIYVVILVVNLCCDYCATHL
jgi:hypothetical protein